VTFATFVTAIIRSLVARFDFFALYPSTVVRQVGQSVEIQPDDPRVPGMKADLRYGLPGTTAQVAKGSRGLLGFENGDPSRPVFSLWEPGDVVQIILGGKGNARGVVRSGDPVALALPPLMLVTGSVASSPVPPGTTMTITTPIVGVAAAGSGKVLATS